MIPPPIHLPKAYRVARIIAIVEGLIMALGGWGIGIVWTVSAIRGPGGFGPSIGLILGIELIVLFGLPGLVYLAVSRFMRRVRLWPGIVLTVIASLQIIICIWLFRALYYLPVIASLIGLAIFLFHVLMLFAAIRCIQAVRRNPTNGHAFQPVMATPVLPLATPTREQT